MSKLPRLGEVNENLSILGQFRPAYKRVKWQRARCPTSLIYDIGQRPFKVGDPVYSEPNC
ncbi:hypothetical protein GCM10007875_17290 [Limnobacter litoralis]|uniref:Uncharacterized protein n=1 Tax=Limnobacter litoralis TaxID=481366 RepID=A0ABQ5YR91_9BURK|nr:hypothetical protein GCM10007875_17290 [Limnobacter litoralis]